MSSSIRIHIEISLNLPNWLTCDIKTPAVFLDDEFAVLEALRWTVKHFNFPYNVWDRLVFFKDRFSHPVGMCHINLLTACWNTNHVREIPVRTYHFLT